MLIKRVKYRLGLIYKTLLFKLGFGKFLLKNRYGERILVFHGIDKTGETKYNSRFISEVYFDTLINYLTTNYNVISLDDFYNKKFKKNTLNIAITFDDGYLNNYKYAVPILKKYKVPASFYITTIFNKAPYLWADFLDVVSYHTNKQEVILKEKLYHKNNNNEFLHNGTSLKNTSKTLPYNVIKLMFEAFKDDWEALPPIIYEDYWMLMNAKHIKEIAGDPLFTIGAHAETHASLVHIPIEEAKQEILNSKKQLEQICERPITEFAFPFGHYNQQLIDYCKKIGFERLLLVDYRTKLDVENNVCRHRFVINPYISLEHQIACLLKGSYY